MVKMYEIIKRLTRRNKRRRPEAVSGESINVGGSQAQNKPYELEDLVRERGMRDLSDEDRQWLDAPPVGKEEI